MAIREGAPAPAFDLVDDTGRRARLSDFGGRRLVLFFYSKDGTSG